MKQPEEDGRVYKQMQNESGKKLHKGDSYRGWKAMADIDIDNFGWFGR